MSEPLPPRLHALAVLAASLSAEVGVVLPDDIRALLPKSEPAPPVPVLKECNIDPEPHRERKPKYRRGGGACEWCGCTLGHARGSRCMNRMCEKFNQPRLG